MAPPVFVLGGGRPMRYSFSIGMRISGQPDDLERALDRVMDELVRLNAVDPSISATIDEGEVEISVVVDADTPDAAVVEGASTVRTALHAAEWHTPTWPAFNARSVGARLVDA
jgi:hypothetical protein